MFLLGAATHTQASHNPELVQPLLNCSHTCGNFTVLLPQVVELVRHILNHTRLASHRCLQKTQKHEDERTALTPKSIKPKTNEICTAQGNPQNAMTDTTSIYVSHTDFPLFVLRLPTRLKIINRILNRIQVSSDFWSFMVS